LAILKKPSPGMETFIVFSSKYEELKNNNVVFTQAPTLVFGFVPPKKSNFTRHDDAPLNFFDFETFKNE